MVDSDALKCIECAILHTCAKKVNGSERCLQCEIGYRFIVCEPITLKCNHFICKECKNKLDKTSEINCKICNAKIESTGLKGAASEAIVKLYLKELTSQLNDKYSLSLGQFEGKKLSFCLKRC